MCGRSTSPQTVGVDESLGKHGKTDKDGGPLFDFLGMTVDNTDRENLTEYL